LLSPFLSTIPTLLTLPQPHKGTHQSAYNGGSGAQHGGELNSAANSIANTTNTTTAPMALTTTKKLF
jgi:hypothetical protein